MTPVTSFCTPFGDIVVLRDRSSVAYWQDGRYQSHADTNGISRAGYIHAIHGLVLQARARDVLMIGCGGGTLATMLHASGVKATIAEINPCSIDVSREHFALPDEIECHVADGREFLQENARQFDAVVLDVYDGDNIPEQLRCAEFFRLVRLRLRDGGCFFANVIVRKERDRRLRGLVQEMNAAWPVVRVLDSSGTRVRNAIAMAGAVQNLEPPRLTLTPKTGSKTIIRELEAMSFQHGTVKMQRRRTPRTEPSRPRQPAPVPAGIDPELAASIV